MADYTSKYTGRQIDEALTSALDVKQVRGIVKITEEGPVAAIPGEDFPDGSGSTVSVTGLLKGVLNEDTNEIEVQQAKVGEDYQTPLKAGVDYASPSAVANKQSKITATGLLKCDGDGTVSAVEVHNATLFLADWSGDGPYTYTLSVPDITATSNGSIRIAQMATDEQWAAWGEAQIRVTGQSAGILTLTATGEAPVIDIPVEVWYA